MKVSLLPKSPCSSSQQEKTASRRSLRNPIRCFDQAAASVAAFFCFLRFASRPTLLTPAALNVTWSGYSADQFVATKANIYYGVSSGLRHKKPEWPAESPICLLFGGSV